MFASLIVDVLALWRIPDEHVPFWRLISPKAPGSALVVWLFRRALLY